MGTHDEVGHSEKNDLNLASFCSMFMDSGCV